MKETSRRIDSYALPIGELLRKPLFYSVPVYQRDFSWTSEEVDILWGDITSALVDGRTEYFLGAIVTSSTSDDKTREIVDGQQRLAALSMIFAVIGEEWKSRNDEKRAMGVFRDYLGTEDRRTSDVIPKLHLNETNDSIYQKLVLRAEKATAAEQKNWLQSNRLLESALTRIKSKVHDWINETDDPTSRLLDLEEFISDKTNIILIEVGDESDAFVIFETLNDRGLDLAVSDLVKNYLFSLAGPHIDRFKKLWSEMALLVGAENMTPFLRHFWLSEHEIIRERELYRALRAAVKTPTASRQFIERLRKAADLYTALLNPEHSYWSDFPAEVRTYLDAIILFKVTQFRPVALAAMETFKPDDVTKVLRTLMVISFRYTVVSALGTGNLERIYTDAALAIRNGQAKSPAKVFSYLRQAYISDTSFVENFSARRFNKAPIARYVLAEINDYLEKDQERMVAERTGRITLEHVLPRNPGKDWKGAIPKDEAVEDYFELVGNLTLLEKGRNRGIANASFATKKAEAYGKSPGLAINRELVKYPSWTSSEIKDRSDQLAKAATKIWRIDY